MKHSLISLLMFPLWLGAQDCKLKKTTDPYTKEVQVSTGFMQFDGASLAINADSKEVDFFFSMDAKEKCFSDGSTIIVVYEGKKMKATFRNAGPVNCEGIFHIIFKNMAATPALLQRLITQKITSFQFFNNSSNNKPQSTVTLSEEQQQSFMTRADCLIKEGKTLVK
jgi:hypothetical protein